MSFLQIMSENGEAGEQYVVDEIVGHMRKRDLIAKGSTLAYDESDLKSSKCKYAFQVRWVGWIKDEDLTWQSYESFEDKTVPKNYARRNALELFERTLRKQLSQEEIRKIVNEIEATCEKKDGSEPKANPTEDMMDPSSMADGEEKRGKDNEDKTPSDSSTSVISYAKVKGLKIHTSEGEKNWKNKINDDDDDDEKRKKMSMRKEEENGSSQFKRKEEGEEGKMEQKKKGNEHGKRAVIESSDSEDSDGKEKTTKRKKRDSSEVDESSKGEKNAKRISRVAANESAMEVDMIGLGEESRRQNNTKKDPESDDEIMIIPTKKKHEKEKTIEKGEAKKRQSMEERKRPSMEDISPKEKKKSPIRKRQISSSESDESEEGEGEDWELEKLITHVSVKEVREGRDIEGKDKLDWEKIDESKLPIIFRALFKYTTDKWRKKKFEWLTIEDLDDVPLLNRYASSAKLTLPKNYVSMMKKKETKTVYGDDDDDLFEA